jgi:Macrocin-O-methyltransferase (TylF)
MSLLAGLKLAESGRILPPKDTVSVRPYPFPYRAAFTVNNDADSMRHNVFEDWHAFVSGRKTTAYGDGLGLEIGDSFWIWAATIGLLSLHEQHPSTKPWVETRKLERIVELGRAGWLDTLHGIGAWSDDYAPPRDVIKYGLDRLAQLGVRPNVWVNHGATASNIGCAPWAEGWYQKVDTPGDPSYAMDLLRQFGFRYYWIDVCFELDKFGDHLDYGHQSLLDRALTKYEWGHWRNRYKKFDLNDPRTRERFIGFFNKTLTSMESNDDQPMYLFKRFRGTDLPSTTTFAGQVTADRLDSLQACVIDVIEKGVPGDFIETGVWRGGATILMRAIMKACGVADRTVWAADSFEGLPEPDAEKYPAEAKAYHGAVMKKVYNRLAAGLEEVQRNFEAYGLLEDRVKFLKGWFKDTLPVAPIKRLAVLRVDGDFCESTRDPLVNLYDKLSPGGYAIVDDYGEDMWTYCRKAVDEFRQERGITDPMIRVDARCVYWQRSG